VRFLGTVLPAEFTVNILGLYRSGTNFKNSLFYFFLFISFYPKPKKYLALRIDSSGSINPCVIAIQDPTDDRF
jgi:hypothetical protein